MDLEGRGWAVEWPWAGQGILRSEIFDVICFPVNELPKDCCPCVLSSSVVLILILFRTTPDLNRKTSWPQTIFIRNWSYTMRNATIWILPPNPHKTKTNNNADAPYAPAPATQNKWPVHVLVPSGVSSTYCNSSIKQLWRTIPVVYTFVKKQK